jgi:hypothetical protein
MVGVIPHDPLEVHRNSAPAGRRWTADGLIGITGSALEKRTFVEKGAAIEKTLGNDVPLAVMFSISSCT